MDRNVSKAARTFVILLMLSRSDYDAIVDATGCSGSEDTLQCLREVPYDEIKAAIDASPGIFAYQVSSS